MGKVWRKPVQVQATTKRAKQRCKLTKKKGDGTHQCQGDRSAGVRPLQQRQDDCTGSAPRPSPPGVREREQVKRSCVTSLVPEVKTADGSVWKNGRSVTATAGVR